MHVLKPHTRIGRGEGALGSDPPPPENHVLIGFLSNTGPDPLNNLKATKPAFMVGSSLARKRTAFRMRA